MLMCISTEKYGYAKAGNNFPGAQFYFYAKEFFFIIQFWFYSNDNNQCYCLQKTEEYK